jgi:hypothetical protein
MTTSYQNCVGSNPLIVLKTGSVITLVSPRATNDNFQWESWTCVSTSTSDVFTTTTQQVIGTSTGSFILDNTVSYGDFMVIFFLFLFTAFAIFNFIFKFVFKQKVSFRN